MAMPWRVQVCDMDANRIQELVQGRCTGSIT